MAEIETATSAKHKHGKKLNKKSTRVDLTPMVDLGFLLLTFFVFTTSMARPTAMNLITPNDKDSTTATNICESCVLTVMLDKDNKIFYYEGMPENNPAVKETAFTTNGIRKILLQKIAAVKKTKGTAEDMVLVIKPGAESAFKNFVDIADEVTINNIKHYFIDEINSVDKKLLSKN